MSKFESPQRPVDHEQPPVIDIVPRKTVRHIPLAPHQYTERITPSKDVFVLGHVGIPRARAEDCKEWQRGNDTAECERFEPRKRDEHPRIALGGLVGGCVGERGEGRRCVGSSFR